jgi:hypothetical protein
MMRRKGRVMGRRGRVEEVQQVISREIKGRKEREIKARMVNKMACRNSLFPLRIMGAAQPIINKKRARRVKSRRINNKVKRRESQRNIRLMMNPLNLNCS